MTDLPHPEDEAREEIARLLPVRALLSRRSHALRQRGAASEQRDALLERAQRCERVMRLLDARVRLAAERIAMGAVAPVDVDALLHDPEAS